MTREFTKYPQGPSSTGGQGARALAGVTDGYAQRHGGDFTAWSNGEKEWVTPVGISYESQGTRMKGGVAALRRVAATDWRLPFVQPGRGVGDLNCDHGLQLFGSTTPLALVPTTYHYPPAYVGGVTTIPVIFDTWARELYHAFGRSEPAPDKFIGYPAPVVQRNTLFNLWIRRPARAYIGRVTTGADKRAQVWETFSAPTGRLDVAGRPMYDPAIALLNAGIEPELFMLPVSGPAGQREFGYDHIMTASKDITYILVLEYFAGCWGVVADEDKDLRPPVSLYRVTDGGASVSITDIKDVFSADFVEPRQHVAYWIEDPPAGPGGPRPPGFWGETRIPLVAGKAAITDPAQHSHTQKTDDGDRVLYPMLPNDIEVAMQRENIAWLPVFARHVMVSNTTWLLAYLFITRVGDQFKHRMRVISVTPTDVTAVYTSAVDAVQYAQSMVHAGGGKVIIKRVHGFDGTNFDIDLMVSADAGATWSTVVPTGLPAALKNQFYGDLFVASAAGPDTPPTLLLPCWDAARGAFCLYKSQDDGATWAYASTLSKSEQFYRVDTMLSGDGGGNFDLLSVTGNVLARQAVDIALPGRYVR